MREKRKQKKVGQDRSEIVRDIPLACADETVAVEFLERMRGWDENPACLRCGDTDVYKMKDRETGERNRRYLWRCRGCNRQYTVRIGTVFEDSRIPLRHWCYGFWAACASKKGVSALQIKRMTGLSYPSALFMMHRIRWAMTEDDWPPKLGGDVEADETFVGGKPRYKGQSKRGRGSRKHPVVALVERGGNVRATPMKKVTVHNLAEFIGENVSTSARFLTDEFQPYKIIGRSFREHEWVRHSGKEYARDDVHVNTAESFFSLIKRGVYGTFHSVSRKHLHRYVSEFQFRWNTRHVDDGERTRRAIRGAEGKRLYYKNPIGDA